LYFAAAQLPIAQTGKIAGRATEYFGEEPAAGRSFRDLIRPQVQADEETSQASSSSSAPSSRKTEAGHTPEELILNGGARTSEKQPGAGAASTANLAGATVDSSAARGTDTQVVAVPAGATVDSSAARGTDAQVVAVPAGATVDSSRARGKDAQVVAVPAGATVDSSAARGKDAQVVAAPAAVADQSSEAACSQNRAPSGYSNGSTCRQGDNAGFESAATDRSAQIYPQQQRQSSDALVKPVPRFADPVVAPMPSAQVAFEMTAEGAGATHSSDWPGSTVARGEKSEDGSMGQQETGQVPLAAYTRAAAQPERASGLASGANSWAMAIPAPTATATRALGESGSNHSRLAAVPISTPGELKKSEAPLSTGHGAGAGHGASTPQSTFAAAQPGVQSEQGLSADARAAGGAPLTTSGAIESNETVSIHQKSATTNPRISTQAPPGASRNPVEAAAAGLIAGTISSPRKAESIEEIAHGSSQPSHFSTEVLAETAEQGVNAAPAKTMGHSAIPVFAAGSMAHSPGGTGVESSVPSPGVTTPAPALHPPSGTAAAPASIPVMHSAHAAAGATFERMDSAAAPEVMESTPQRLAVGVRSQGLGWVEIRTSNTAGQVSATFATGSVESQSAVSAQLPSVREYLAGEHVHIDNLASERFSSSSGGGEGSGNEGSRNASTAEAVIAPRTVSGDAEVESLSYINVRV
jgi:hypothetical protein